MKDVRLREVMTRERKAVNGFDEKDRREEVEVEWERVVRLWSRGGDDEGEEGKTMHKG